MVKLPNSIESLDAHPEFIEMFNKVAGQTLKVVGRDEIGHAWVDIGSEVLSLDPIVLN